MDRHPERAPRPLVPVRAAGPAAQLVGSTLLGIALLRNGLRPRSAAWLLTLTIPVAVAALQVTSMGSAALAVMFGFGILGRRMAAERTHVAVARTAAA